MSVQSSRSGVIASALILSLFLVSAVSAQQTMVNPNPGQGQMLGVHTNFVQLGFQYFVPNRGLPQGQPGGGGQPAVAVSPPGNNWFWDGYISSGCRITSVTPGSVAARAGLEVGDTVLSLNGKPMTHAQALANAVGHCQGQNVLCWVINVRNGQLTSVWCDFRGGWGGGVPANPVPSGNGGW